MKYKLQKSSYVILSILIMFINSTIYGETEYVRRTKKKHMYYNKNGVRQEAFYDFGTALPYDNARIFAYSKGNNKNYAEIEYCDLGLGDYMGKDMSSEGGEEAYVNYTSRYDYLDDGSFAYSKGDSLTQYLKVIK